jgi:hypothetical protein
VTVHVVPETLVTIMISEGCALSATRNWLVPVTAAGKPAELATVHVSDVPPAGAVVPPDETVVVGPLLAKMS